MVKRLLSCFASDFNKMTAADLKQSILASEGRTIVAENVCDVTPALPPLTNTEIAKAFGADLMLLNHFNLDKPYIAGLPESDNPIKKLKEYVGRPIGVNLEPIDTDAVMQGETVVIDEGRQATENTLKKANEIGLDFICLTGNPSTGVTNKTIANSVKLAHEVFDGLIIAGKMHGAGVNEPIIDLEVIEKFIDLGADIILVPGVGTVPGVTQEDIINVVQLAKSKGALVMSAIGTSQETSGTRTIHDIAIKNKIAGVDIQHIGDGGYGGVAPIENIFELSKAIRGVKHTVKLLAASNRR